MSAFQKPPSRAPASLQTGLAAIGTDVMERLTEAAGMLRIGGLETRADKAEQSQLRRAAPVDDLRQRHQDQEGTGPPPGVERAPVGWWNTVVQSRLAQVQNLLRIGRLPSTTDEPPPRPLRRREGVEDLRAGLHEDGERQAQSQQAPQDLRDQNDQAESPQGVLRRQRSSRDLRVRFTDDAGRQPGRGLRRRPRFNDLRGRYQADPDDDLAL